LSEEITFEDLPHSMQELVRETGIKLEAVLKLMHRWGGRIQLYIHKEIRPDHDLARELGIDAARQLSLVYGGDFLRSIPRAAKVQRAARNREILRLRTEGLAPCDIARKVGLTERMVWRILSQHTEPTQAPTESQESRQPIAGRRAKSHAIPASEIARKMRDQEIVKRRAEGASLAELAEEFEMGRGGVLAILQWARQRQAELAEVE